MGTTSTAKTITETIPKVVKDVAAVAPTVAAADPARGS